MKWFVLLIIMSVLSQLGCSKIDQKEVAQNVANLEKTSITQNNASTNAETKFGYVPDEKAAIEIAVKAWVPIYGKEKIENEKPYHASLKNGIWKVTGSLPEGSDGGVAEATISQKDGRVLKIIHGQ
jgi:NTF2 fold immunity protein